MRNGYKVYDSDTHIRPGADTLEKYLSARVRELVPDLESRKVPHSRHSTGLEYDSTLPADASASAAATPSAAGERTCRARWARQSRAPQRAGPPANSWGVSIRSLYSDDWDVDGRIHDMDEEGVDVQLLVNPGGPSGHENPEVNIEFMRAQHRYPGRLLRQISAPAQIDDRRERQIYRGVSGGDQALESLDMGRWCVRQPAD